MTLANDQKKHQEKKLDQASRRAIQKAIPRLQKHWQRGTWLAGHNQYRVNTVKQVEYDSKKEKFKHRDLADYVAASAISHCFDGWSYLARALEAEMSGDPDAARHLGYYAELRAAMSILAGEGVGIFHSNHVIVSDENKCQSLKGLSTHTMVWEALNYLAESRSPDLIPRLIKPEGCTLREWIEHFGGSDESLANAWLKEWGLDLSRLSDDREARNLASYRPTALTSPGARGIGKTVSAVAQFWKMCSPGSGGGFPVMDRHLLRLGLGMLFKHEVNRSPLQAKKKYSRKISTMLDSFGFTEEVRLRWEKFLKYEIEQETPQLFLDARGKDQPSHIDHSKQVLARATLLLRMATGSLSELLREGSSKLHSDLDFWWSGPSVRRCLWAIDNPPVSLDSFVDLWKDVDEALDVTHNWIDATNQPECYYSFWAQNPHAAKTLTTSERIFLWGVSG